VDLLLSQAITDYLAHKRAVGYKFNSLRNHERALRYLFQVVGEMPVREVGMSQMTAFFEHRQQLDGASTLNNHRAALAVFFKWAVASGNMPAGSDPLHGFTRNKVMPGKHLRIPASKFDELLNAAEDPRDRMMVALGLYLFLRGSEIQELRMRDVDLEHHEMHVMVEKTSQRDIMPICEELAQELRRWHREYRSQVAKLGPNDYLIPAQVMMPYQGTLRGVLVPGRPHPQGYRNIQRALERAGWAIRDENGKSLREGQHTLRRSGARALFDERLKDGYDGALRQVQAMLHHSTGAMTEKYLGIDIDSYARNRAIGGRAMFKDLRVNVRHLQVAS